MATPTLTRHVVPGTLGDILVDVRAANRASAGPAVVVLHGFKGFKDWGFFPPLAERLAKAGFAAVSYNASGSGVDDSGEFVRPDRFGRNTFTAELRDLGAVQAALDAGGLGVPRPTITALVGHSRGGGIAILGSAGNPRVGALVTWAAVASPFRWSEEMKRRWRQQGFLEVKNQRTGLVLPLYPDILDDLDRNGAALDIGAAADRITVPWLVLHGEQDETVQLKEGEALAGSRAAPEFRVIPATGHTFGAAHPFAGSTPALDEVMDRTVAFLSRHLP